MTLIKAIEKTKAKLIKKCRLNGLYENFGQNEVYQLEIKFIDTSDYSKEMNTKRELIRAFDNWCLTYDGK